MKKHNRERTSFGSLIEWEDGTLAPEYRTHATGSDIHTQHDSLNDTENIVPYSINPNLLYQQARENGIQTTCINKKISMVTEGYKSEDLPLITFGRLVSDYFWFGNALLDLADPKAPLHLNARIVRLGRKKYKNAYLLIEQGEIARKIKAEYIVHLIDYDPGSAFYGIPSYVSAIKLITLISSAMQYRQRFYDNGTHGRILFTAIRETPQVDEQGKDKPDPNLVKIQEIMRSTKAQGQHKSALINLGTHAQTKLEDVVKMIELGQKLEEDDFANTVNMAVNQLVVANGLHPELIGFSANNKTAANLSKAQQVARQTFGYSTQDLFKSALAARGIDIDFDRGEQEEESGS